jgi:deazaflavin-dependent oxidoreductase (nitroreductase family)
MSRRASVVRRLGHKAWFARFVRVIVVPLDTVLGRWTKGRILSVGRRELPTLLITTTGRLTGRPRTVPLLYAPDGDGFIVIGSNFGQPHHPAWSANLLADPRATAILDGVSMPVVATFVNDPERTRMLDLLVSYWPAYRTYEVRASNRELRVFRLAPVTAAAPAVTQTTTHGSVETEAIQPDLTPLRTQIARP